MAAVHSIREFHSELATVCSSLEALFRIVGNDYPDVDAAVAPVIDRFRDLLDQGDNLAGPDE